MSAEYTLDSPLPSGSWTIYFHSPEETKWTLNTFVNMGSMKTWGDFWSVIETLKAESLADGMFFMMRDPCPPLWESHVNIYGGCYSFRCQKRDASEIYINYMIACMLGKCGANPTNTVNGISISPKRGFNIIKVWNADAKKFKNPEDITLISPLIKHSDIMYTPFVQKKM
jgi:hypothetical protein